MYIKALRKNYDQKFMINFGNQQDWPDGNFF